MEIDDGWIRVLFHSERLIPETTYIRVYGIDDVEMWDRMLTPEEIQVLASKRKAKVEKE